MKMKPLLGVASAANNNPELMITDEQWRALGEAIGQEIPPKARSQIQNATRQYLFWEGLEQAAPGASDAEKRLERISDAGRAFIKCVRAGLVDGTDVAMQLKRLIIGHLAKDQGAPSGGLHSAEKQVGALLRAVQHAQNEIGSDHSSGFVSGSVWKQWIRALASICRENKLPAGARKDHSDFGVFSPFVNFVAALQTGVLKRRAEALGSFSERVSAALKVPQKPHASIHAPKAGKAPRASHCRRGV